MQRSRQYRLSLINDTFFSFLGAKDPSGNPRWEKCDWSGIHVYVHDLYVTLMTARITITRSHKYRTSSLGHVGVQRIVSNSNGSQKMRSLFSVSHFAIHSPIDRVLPFFFSLFLVLSFIAPWIFPQHSLVYKAKVYLMLTTIGLLTSSLIMRLA